jgi:hypothetical protein
MEETQTDVETTPSLTADAATDSSSVTTETSTANGNAGDVIAVDVAAEDDPLKDIPTLEELKQQAEQKIPGAAGLASLRAAYESVAPLKSWQEVATQIGDPSIAKDYYELMEALRTPVEGQPNEYTTRPFIEKLDSLSPGIANELFFELMSYELPDENGRVDRMTNHFVRSLGLDPTRIDDYRNIDTVRASGAVTSDDLAGIPERFHSAFRALSSAQRDDFILQKDANGQYSLASMEYLQDKAEALEARQWREQQAEQQKQVAEQQQQAFETQLQQEIVEDVTSEAKSVYDSILQNLSSQVTFSSDPVQDKITKAGMMALLSQVQSPYPYQQQEAVNTLKEAGIELNGFGELLNRFEERRAAYKRFERMGDQLQARRALSEYTIVKQQVLAKSNDFALRLAKANGERVATQAAQQNGQLATAAARYVPSGSQAQNGSPNPYEQNPHPVGSQEYFAYNRNLDKQFKLTGASMFG